MEGFFDEWPLDSKRSNSLPNLLGLVGKTGEKPPGYDGSGGSIGSCGSRGSGASDESSISMAMHVPHDTLMQAARSMERLQVELENREQVIRELVELRARDKNDFEMQMNVLQGQLLAERRRNQDQQLRTKDPGTAAKRW